MSSFFIYERCVFCFSRVDLVIDYGIEGIKKSTEVDFFKPFCCQVANSSEPFQAAIAKFSSFAFTFFA